MADLRLVLRRLVLTVDPELTGLVTQTLVTGLQLTDPPPVIMSEENSCCGFKRKTVCMSLIGVKYLNLLILNKLCFRALLPDLGGLDCDNNSVSSY